MINNNYTFDNHLYCIYIPKYIELISNMRMLVISNPTHLKHIVDDVTISKSTSEYLYEFNDGIFPKAITIKNTKTNISRMFSIIKIHEPSTGFWHHEVLEYNGTIRSEDYLNGTYNDIKDWKLFIKII